MFIWTRCDTGEITGRNGLVKLAIRVLSVIANSGGCERVFSEFGITHTKRRNKLSPERVHKSSVVKTDIRRGHAAAGLLKTRKKRAFGDDLTAGPSHPDTAQTEPEAVDLTTLPDAEEHLADFDDLQRQLIDDAEANDNFSTYAESIPILHASTTSQLPHRIPLEKLFIYPEHSLQGTELNNMGLAFYWKGGLRNLEKELAAYEAMYQMDISAHVNVPPQAQGVASGEGISNGSLHNP